MFLQITLSLFVFIIVVEIWLRYKKKDMSFISLLFWLILWGGVLTVAWYAEITVYIAHLLRIERGIDSVVYLSIVLLFYLVFRILLKVEKTERTIEELVRIQTLKDGK